jgi:pimeloyl-ACP methyl ester carboxylesterase
VRRPAAIVLLHGSLLGPWCWDEVAGALVRRGHHVHAPALPYGDPKARGTEHIAAIRDVLDDCGQGTLTFVAHSLAGLLAPGIANAWPGSRIIYLAGLLPMPNVSLIEQLDDEPQMFQPEWARWDAEPVWADRDRAVRFLFHDADRAVAERAAERVVADNSALAAERAPSGWPVSEASYICPSGDRTISASWMRAVARQRLGVSAIELDAGHCPQVSQPDALATLIDRLLCQLRLVP